MCSVHQHVCNPPVQPTVPLGLPRRAGKTSPDGGGGGGDKGRGWLKTAHREVKVYLVFTSGFIAYALRSSHWPF
jgi:hypothetical protein